MKKKSELTNQFNRIAKIMRAKIQTATKIERIAFLIKLGNCCERRMTIEMKQDFDASTWQNRCSHYLKLMPWYKDQQDSRRDLIQAHPTFFCPISGDILGMEDSFIIEGHGIVSAKGLNRAYNASAIGALKRVIT